MSFDLMEELKKRLRENISHQSRVDLAYAYGQGYDCGMNGPNETNSHYAIFSQPQYTKEWERGKAQAEADKLRADSTTG